MLVRFSIVTLLAWICVAALAQSTAPLVHEGTIGASVEDVWRAWTTNEGLRSWIAPHAEIDLRIGGRMRTNYNPAEDLNGPGTIENTILAFEPERMLSFRVSRAPDDFPFAAAVREMWTVMYFEPVDTGQTRIRIVALGFTPDEESQAMRTFFDAGNATTLEQMRQRIESVTQ